MKAVFEVGEKQQKFVRKNVSHLKKFARKNVKEIQENSMESEKVKEIKKAINCCMSGNDCTENCCIYYKNKKL